MWLDTGSRRYLCAWWTCTAGKKLPWQVWAARHNLLPGPSGRSPKLRSAAHRGAGQGRRDVIAIMILQSITTTCQGINWLCSWFPTAHTPPPRHSSPGWRAYPGMHNCGKPALVSSHPLKPGSAYLPAPWDSVQSFADKSIKNSAHLPARLAARDDVGDDVPQAVPAHLFGGAERAKQGQSACR